MNNLYIKLFCTFWIYAFMSDKFLAVELWNQKYTRGLQDHSPPNQGLNLPPTVEAQSLNCWTTREVSIRF